MTTTSRIPRRPVGAAIGLLLAATLSGCGSSTTDDSAGNVTESTATEAAETVVVDATATETASEEAATAETTAGTSATTDETMTADLPAGVEPGSPEAAAWEALMGADGEYAAFAMYGAVIDAFGPVEPYVTIQQAEGRHIDALIRQLERRGLTVPDNPYLGQVTAPSDLPTAAANWAEGEVANIALYDELFAQVETDPQLTRVFTNLRRASAEEHLPMFTEAAAGDGTLSADQMADLGHGGMGGHSGEGGHSGQGG